MKNINYYAPPKTEYRSTAYQPFMHEKDKFVVSGCTICRKNFGTIEQFKRHITDDGLRAVFDKL